MPGRRWSDGLHQAVEAKEGVQIERETQTLATITIQNYFRLYEKLAGMTGTAETEAQRVSRHLPARCRRHPDQPAGPPHRRERSHLQDAPREVQRRDRGIKERPRKGQPVLVGTASVEASRAAQPHAQAAEDSAHGAERQVSTCRRPRSSPAPASRGAVTISTNMAGRGTDIKLGAGVAEARRPLRHRHRAPRIAAHRPPAARTLRAPGRPRPYRVSTSASRTTSCATFGAAERMTKIMETLGLKEGEELEHPGSTSASKPRKNASSSGTT